MTNINMAKMRIGCSLLNYDLYHNLHVVDSSTCRCGYHIENTYHYFFECPLYELPRRIMQQKIAMIAPLNLRTLLYGSNVTYRDNTAIMEAVHEFVECTKRFA